MLNKQTNGFLVIDVGDKIPVTEEAYAVTTSKGIGAVTRSIFILQRYKYTFIHLTLHSRVNETDGFEDDRIHFGQKIRITSNPYIISKPVF
jgi:hypothetical protein